MTTAASIATAPTVVVSEVFGPTIQGEGPHTGQAAAFVRLGGCNLTCTWCDTAYTWDGEHYDLRAEMSRVTVAEVATEVLSMGVRLCILTGGEPLLQQGSGPRQWQQGLIELARDLTGHGVRCEVETNGTIRPRDTLVDAVNLFVVSPKLGNAGMSTLRTIKPDVLARWAELARAGLAAFKFVCRDPVDVLAAARIMDDHNVPSDRVWVMPEGTNPAVLTERGKQLVTDALVYGFNFTTRLHVLLWGNERGR